MHSSIKWLRRVVFALILLAALLVSLILGIGWFIAPHDDLVKSDGIVVVSGGDTNKRVDEGIALWQDGWAPRLYFSGAAADQGTSNAAVMRARAIAKGVPADAIRIEEKSTTTIENAAFLQPLLVQDGARSLILVSSPYHNRRVKVTFAKELGPGFHLTAHPAKDSRWARSSWWEQPDTVDLTLSELRKTLYVVFIQR